jgi:hypothetical protein
VSTPEPTPNSPARKLGRLDYFFLALFAGAFVGAVLWGLAGAPPFWRVWHRFDSRSVIIDEERESRPGVIVQSGRIYSQARIELPPGVELVIPATRLEYSALPNRHLEVKTHFDGKPGEVLVLIETRISDGGHPSESSYLPRSGGGRTVWKRQQGTVLAIDVPAGYLFVDYAVRPTVIFVVPPGQLVRQEPPTATAFADRSDDDNEKSKTAGWEAVSTHPLARGRFR